MVGVIKDKRGFPERMRTEFLISPQSIGKDLINRLNANYLEKCKTATVPIRNLLPLLRLN